MALLGGAGIAAIEADAARMKKPVTITLVDRTEPVISWLITGWGKVSEGGNDALLLENRLVDRSMMIRTYARPDDNEPPARIFVAVWPVNGVNGFHVVLATANPSPPYRLANGLLI